MVPLLRKLSIVFCAVFKTYCGVKESQNVRLCSTFLIEQLCVLSEDVGSGAAPASDGPDQGSAIIRLLKKGLSLSFHALESTLYLSRCES